MGPRNKLFIRNGEKWTRILLFWTAGEETRSLQLYRLSASSVCVSLSLPDCNRVVRSLSGQMTRELISQQFCCIWGMYSGGRPDPQCEQNISEMRRVEIGSGWDISCCQELICIKHFLSAEKLLEKEWLFWVKSTILCLFAGLPVGKHFTVGLSRVGVLLRSVYI